VATTGRRADRERNGRPPEAAIEARNDERREAEQPKEGHDDPLHLLLLSLLVQREPAFEERGVLLEEVQARRRHPGELQPQVDPCLPEPQRPRRRKEDDRDRREKLCRIERDARPQASHSR